MSALENIASDAAEHGLPLGELGPPPLAARESEPLPLVAREAPVEGIDECDQHLALHLDAARRCFGPSALGVVDLPPLGSARVVTEQVRVAAVLLWAREVEAAGVLPFVEALAEAVMRGAVMEPLGDSARELVRFWRGRAFRMAEPERRALYARLFDAGTPEAPGFEQRFAALVDALAALGREAQDRGTAGLEARIALMATEIGALLSDRAVGIAAFAARDIVAQVRWSIRLLQDPDLSRGLGGGGLVLILSRHGPRLLRRPLDPLRHFARASAGQRLIAWIAERSLAAPPATAGLSRHSPIIREAEAWRAASGGR